MVLFGTAIPQVPRFCCTVLTRNDLTNNELMHCSASREHDIERIMATRTDYRPPLTSVLVSGVHFHHLESDTYDLHRLPHRRHRQQQLYGTGTNAH